MKLRWWMPSTVNEDWTPVWTSESYHHWFWSSFKVNSDKIIQNEEIDFYINKDEWTIEIWDEIIKYKNIPEKQKAVFIWYMDEKLYDVKKYIGNERQEKFMKDSIIFYKKNNILKRENIVCSNCGEEFTNQLIWVRNLSCPFC